MANFNIEFEKLILAEGGYVNDSDDAGGETYLGISRKNNPKWIGWKTIDSIKKIYGNKNITARLKENESLESALRRFKKQCARAGVIAEVRKREAYEKPSVKRKKKSEAARKRKYK